MSHGSLYDILHNNTMVLEGDLLLPIMRDISSGLRFLHASNPQIIHGDLKVCGGSAREIVELISFVTNSAFLFVLLDRLLTFW